MLWIAIRIEVKHSLLVQICKIGRKIFESMEMGEWIFFIWMQFCCWELIPGLALLFILPYEAKRGTCIFTNVYCVRVEQMFGGSWVCFSYYLEYTVHFNLIFLVFVFLLWTKQIKFLIKLKCIFFKSEFSLDTQ